MTGSSETVYVRWQLVAKTCTDTIIFNSGKRQKVAWHGQIDDDSHDDVSLNKTLYKTFHRMACKSPR